MPKETAETSTPRKPRSVEPLVIEQMIENKVDTWSRLEGEHTDTASALRWLREHGTPGTFRVIQVKRIVTIESVTVTKNVIK